MTELRLVESAEPTRKCVYAIGLLNAAGTEYAYIKIGISSNPLARLDTLQTGNPTKLWICGWIDANPWAEEMEKALHLLLDRERAEGEWFAMTERTEAVLRLMGLLTYDRWQDGEPRSWPKWMADYRRRIGTHEEFERLECLRREAYAQKAEDRVE